MLQDPNVERYVQNAIAPLKRQIASMKSEINLLKEINKNLSKPATLNSKCVHKGCKKSSMCGDYCGNHCNCRKKEK